MLKVFWEKISRNYKESVFYLGIFLMPSAFSFSVILLLASSIFKLIEGYKHFLKDKFNNYLLCGGAFMIISSIVHSLNINDSELVSWSPYLSWIGLANWVPFFIISWSFEPYLANPEQRKKCGFILLSGSIPVIFTCIGQAFFNLNGPIEALNGIIVWYLRPLDGSIFGATGLFNNRNITGAWLNIIWPLSLAFYFEKESKTKQYISLLLIVLISICIILTSSRAAWIGFFMGILLFIGLRSLKWLIGILFIFFVLLILSNSYQELNFLPFEIIDKFNNFQYMDRFEIWSNSLQIITQNPFFGNGASSFTESYKLISGIYKNHSHNIVLELMINYGIPAALLITIPIGYLISKSLKLVAFQSSRIYPFDKALITSLLIILFMHMVDIQYFDGRISIAIWILIAAIKNIVFNNNSLKKRK